MTTSTQTHETPVTDTVNNVTLIDFWAPWCGPCLMQKPVVQKLVEEYNGTAEISFCNVDENPQLAQKYGVVSIPTLVLLNKGKEVQRFVGVQSEKTLRDALNHELNA